jgi:hypothetical protein
MVYQDLPWYNPDLGVRACARSNPQIRISLRHLRSRSDPICSKKNKKEQIDFHRQKGFDALDPDSAGVRTDYLGSSSAQHFLIIEMEYIKSRGFGKVNAKFNTF